ncbi:hypothetical protein E4V51_25205, partial [Paenibacillus sp. 28ISP30-2]|nr:hypothetical protein [Paenibacillus sp. 28ISP30-2]
FFSLPLFFFFFSSRSPHTRFPKRAGVPACSLPRDTFLISSIPLFCTIPLIFLFIQRKKAKTQPEA